MQVAKKTLMQIAAKEAGLPEIEDKNLPGPVACVFSGEDSLAGAQEIWNFGKDHKAVKIVGAIFEGKILSQTDAVALAKIPGRQALLGMFAGMIRSPLTSFASMCASPLSGFARAVNELAKKKPA
jgi:large subunit ribosomal protein L10